MKVSALLGFARSAGCLSIGITATCRSLERGKARAVVLAEDASERTARQIRRLVDGRDTALMVWGSKDELGRLLGRETIGVLAVCDDGFARKLRESVMGGGEEKGFR